LFALWKTKGRQILVARQLGSVGYWYSKNWSKQAMQSLAETIAKQLGLSQPIPLQKPLGQSNLGIVYQIQHPQYGTCVLKYFHGRAQKKAAYLKRFFSVVCKAKPIQHQNLAAIYHVQDQPDLFILRAFVQGLSLEQKLQEKQKLSLLEATQLIEQVATALKHLAKFNIFNKNLKASNVICTQGQAKIVDFALPPTIPYYLSPEQCLKKPSGIGSDIYALGILYYYCLAGALPLSAGTFHQVMEAHIEQECPDIRGCCHHVPDSIAEAIHKMTATQPTERYQNYDDVLAQLEEIQYDIQASAPTKTLEFNFTKASIQAPTTIESLPEEVPLQTIIAPRQAATAIPTLKESGPPPATFAELPKESQDILAAATDIQDFLDGTKWETRKIISFPKDYETAIVSYLYERFHRECWLLKEQENGQIEVEIDFDQALVLYYLHGFEAQVQAALEKVKQTQGPARQAYTQQKNKPGFESMHDTVLLREIAWDQKVSTESKPSSDHQETGVSTQDKLSQETIVESDNQETVVSIQDKPSQETIVESDNQEILVSIQDKPSQETIVESDHQEIVQDKPSEETISEADIRANENAGPMLMETIGQETVALQDNAIGLPVSKKNGVSEPQSVNPTQETLVMNSEDGALEFWKNPELQDSPGEKSVETERDQALEDPSETSDIEQAKAITATEEPKASLAEGQESSMHLDIEVDFDNHYETLGWLKFVRENELQKEVHFQMMRNIAENSKKKKFRIDLNWLLDYEEQQDNISAIKHFFQSDYEIHELGKGGMGIILKLTTKHNATIISLRPENGWARNYFQDRLQIRHGQNGQEMVYAEVPANTSLVVKVAFKDYEESLIREGKTIEEISKDAVLNPWIIGMIQQGHLMAFHESRDDYLGYYLMIEYASQGTAETLYKKFPQDRLTPTVAFTMLYGLTQALLCLKQHALIHRDIKPQNILLNEQGMAKLSDFGLAITTQEIASGLTEDRKRLLRLLDSQFLRISSQKEQVEKKLNTLKERYQHLSLFGKESELAELETEIHQFEQQILDLDQQEKTRAELLQDRYRPMSAEENAEKGQFAGSLYYAAPEQFETDNILTSQCDVYQLGAVMYTMLTGKRPVEGETTSELVSKVIYFPKPKVADSVPHTPFTLSLSDLVAAMMENSAQERITIEKIHDQLKAMFSEFLAEIKKEPEFPPCEAQADSKACDEYEKQIAFAKKMHKKSLRILQKYCVPKKPINSEEQKFIFFCPKCHKKLHIFKRMAGKEGRCPNCHYIIIVQLPS